MHQLLPIFPLKLVAFPGEQVNLHIFEARYRQMITECEDEEKYFGIPAFIDNQLSKYGTEMELVRIAKRHEDGKMNIVTRGRRVFKIENFFPVAPDKLYAGARVSYPEDSMERDFELNIKILEKVRELFEVANVKKGLPEEPEQFITFDLGHFVGFSIKQEYEFLCIPSELKRQEYMLEHLMKIIPIVKNMEFMKKRAKMNGHFKNLPPLKF